MCTISITTNANFTSELFYPISESQADVRVFRSQPGLIKILFEIEAIDRSLRV